MEMNIIGKCVRPDDLMEYQFGDDYKAYISLSPQQKWRVIDETDRAVELTNNKGIIVELPKRDFAAHWTIVKK